MDTKNGKVQLTPVWISRDMNQAEPPVIANSMVFAKGEKHGSSVSGCGPGLQDGTAYPLSRHAVLYVLDAQTGKELWTTGKQIATWEHRSGITVASGSVYIHQYLRRHAVLVRLKK